jgi:hypothetical protein
MALHTLDISEGSRCVILQLITTSSHTHLHNSTLVIDVLFVERFLGTIPVAFAYLGLPAAR